MDTTMNTVKAWCVTLLVAEIVDRFKGEERSIYGADLAFKLTLTESKEGDVLTPGCSDGEWLSFSREAFREYVVPWCRDTYSNVPNPYVDGESYCAVRLYIILAGSLVDACNVVDECWNDETVWTDEKLERLVRELIAQVDFSDVCYASWFDVYNIKHYIKGWFDVYSVKD